MKKYIGRTQGVGHLRILATDLASRQIARCASYVLCCKVKKYIMYCPRLQYLEQHKLLFRNHALTKYSEYRASSGGNAYQG